MIEPGAQPPTENDVLRAACTVHLYDASRILNVRQPGRMNEVPDRDYFRRVFSFSKDRLVQYIEAHEGCADELLGRSEDQRCVPSAFINVVPDGYAVGWFDGEETQVRFHGRIDDAAADFVMLFWGLSRD